MNVFTSAIYVMIDGWFVSKSTQEADDFISHLQWSK